MCDCERTFHFTSPLRFLYEPGRRPKEIEEESISLSLSPRHRHGRLHAPHAMCVPVIPLTRKSQSLVSCCHLHFTCLHEEPYTTFKYTHTALQQGTASASICMHGRHKVRDSVRDLSTVANKRAYGVSPQLLTPCDSLLSLSPVSQ